LSAIPSLNPVAPRPAGGPVSLGPRTPKKSWLGVSILLPLVAAGVWAGYHFWSKPAAQESAAQAAAIRTARVTKGSIRRVLRLTGSTTAKNFRAISAPRVQAPDNGRGLVLTYLIDSGKYVKKGQLLAQIDAQALIDHVDDIESQIQQTDIQIRKRVAEQKLNWQNLEQTLKVAKARLDRAKLDASAAEIRTVVDAELLKLSVEESEATYRELLADVPLMKSSDAMQLRIMEIDKQLQVSHRNRHKQDIEAFMIRAPIDGLAVMETFRRAGEWAQIKQGDQVAPAQPFMKIVDTNSMLVQASASQVESEDVRLGQSAHITFDAYPGLKLNARVANIGAIATPGPRVNYFLRSVPVFLSILDQDNRVIPDLSTSNDIVLEEQENAELIPLEAVESKDGKSFVRVKSGDGYETREVTLGASDNLRIAVDKGVREGEEVALD